MESAVDALVYTTCFARSQAMEVNMWTSLQQITVTS